MGINWEVGILGLLGVLCLDIISPFLSFGGNYAQVMPGCCHWRSVMVAHGILGSWE